MKSSALETDVTAVLSSGLRGCEDEAQQLGIFLTPKDSRRIKEGKVLGFSIDTEVLVT